MPYSVFDMETAKAMKQIFDLGEEALWGEFVNAIGNNLELNETQRDTLLSIADDYASRAFIQYERTVLIRLPKFKKPQDIICP